MTKRVAVTGASSYSGKYIAQRLLARGGEVISLTGHPHRPDPFEGRVQSRPLDFSQPEVLEVALRGCGVLVNTYWIRFDKRSNTQERAVENTRLLMTAARRAGVKRVVHISITNPSEESHLPYFRGKAQNERSVIDSGMSYAILRPTVLFGGEDILINNIAFLLRRFPFFFQAGDGSYRLQPIHVDDLASLADAAVFQSPSTIVDAAGPEILSFRQLTSLIGRTIGFRRRLISVPPSVLWMATAILGAALGDVLLTRHEIEGLMANLLVSREPPRGRTVFSQWLAENKDTIGRHYASELRRHYR
jgi:uncharacterized protein YbjT (DUF2867 family)